MIIEKNRDNFFQLRQLDKFMIGHNGFIAGGCFKNIFENNQSQFRKRYEKYAYLLDAPFKISHHCCLIMKEKPLRKYERTNKVYPIVGTMADESQRRKEAWLKTGCNAFDSDVKTSQPMSFWTEQDVLRYIKLFKRYR